MLGLEKQLAVGIIFVRCVHLLIHDVTTLKPVYLFVRIAKFGHLYGPAVVFGAQDHPLGDIARQIPVLARAGR